MEQAQKDGHCEGAAVFWLGASGNSDFSTFPCAEEQEVNDAIDEVPVPEIDISQPEDFIPDQSSKCSRNHHPQICGLIGRNSCAHLSQIEDTIVSLNLGGSRGGVYSGCPSSESKRKKCRSSSNDSSSCSQSTGRPDGWSSKNWCHDEEYSAPGVWSDCSDNGEIDEELNYSPCSTANVTTSNEQQTELPHVDALRRSYKILLCNTTRTNEIADSLLSKQKLPKEEHEAIIFPSSPYKANRILLSFLLRNDTDVYNCFLEELNATRQIHLYHLLTTSDCDLDRQHVKRICMNYPVLAMKLDPDNGLVCLLMSKDVISPIEKQLIESEQSQYYRTQKLLSLIVMKSLADYLVFLECLEENGQRHLAAALRQCAETGRNLMENVICTTCRPFGDKSNETDGSVSSGAIPAESEQHELELRGLVERRLSADTEDEKSDVTDLLPKAKMVSVKTGEEDRKKCESICAGKRHLRVKRFTNLKFHLHETYCDNTALRAELKRLKQSWPTTQNGLQNKVGKPDTELFKLDKEIQVAQMDFLVDQLSQVQFNGEEQNKNNDLIKSKISIIRKISELQLRLEMLTLETAEAVADREPMMPKSLEFPKQIEDEEAVNGSEITAELEQLDITQHTAEQDLYTQDEINQILRRNLYNTQAALDVELSISSQKTERIIELESQGKVLGEEILRLKDEHVRLSLENEEFQRRVRELGKSNSLVDSERMTLLRKLDMEKAAYKESMGRNSASKSKIKVLTDKCQELEAKLARANNRPAKSARSNTACVETSHQGPSVKNSHRYPGAKVHADTVARVRSDPGVRVHWDTHVVEIRKPVQSRRELELKSDVNRYEKEKAGCEEVITELISERDNAIEMVNALENQRVAMERAVIAAQRRYVNVCVCQGVSACLPEERFAEKEELVAENWRLAKELKEIKEENENLLMSLYEQLSSNEELTSVINWDKAEIVSLKKCRAEEKQKKELALDKLVQVAAMRGQCDTGSRGSTMKSVSFHKLMKKISEFRKRDQEREQLANRLSATETLLHEKTDEGLKMQLELISKTAEIEQLRDKSREEAGNFSEHHLEGWMSVGRNSKSKMRWIRQYVVVRSNKILFYTSDTNLKNTLLLLVIDISKVLHVRGVTQGDAIHSEIEEIPKLFQIIYDTEGALCNPDDSHDKVKSLTYKGHNFVCMTFSASSICDSESCHKSRWSVRSAMIECKVSCTAGATFRAINDSSYSYTTAVKGIFLLANSEENQGIWVRCLQQIVTRKIHVVAAVPSASTWYESGGSPAAQAGASTSMPEQGEGSATNDAALSTSSHLECTKL